MLPEPAVENEVLQILTWRGVESCTAADRPRADVHKALLAQGIVVHEAIITTRKRPVQATSSQSGTFSTASAASRIVDATTPLCPGC